jgi:hypothetical protein
VIRVPDGIVTVRLNGEQYRGAYYFQDEELVVTSYGLQQSSVNLAILEGERGKSARNLAKLVLMDMVRVAMDKPILDSGLSHQGSTTQLDF